MAINPAISSISFTPETSETSDIALGEAIAKAALATTEPTPVPAPAGKKPVKVNPPKRNINLKKPAAKAAKASKPAKAGEGKPEDIAKVAKPVKARPNAKPAKVGEAAKPSEQIKAKDPNARRNPQRVLPHGFIIPDHDSAVSTISRNLPRYRVHCDALKAFAGGKPFSWNAARTRHYHNPETNLSDSVLGSKAVIERLVGAGKLEIVETTNDDIMLRVTNLKL